MISTKRKSITNRRHREAVLREAEGVACLVKHIVRDMILTGENNNRRLVYNGKLACIRVPCGKVEARFGKMKVEIMAPENGQRLESLDFPFEMMHDFCELTKSEFEEKWTFNNGVFFQR